VHLNIPIFTLSNHWVQQFKTSSRTIHEPGAHIEWEKTADRFCFKDNSAGSSRLHKHIMRLLQGKGKVRSVNNHKGRDYPITCTDRVSRCLFQTVLLESRLIISFQMGNGCEVMVYQCPAKIVPCCVLHTKPSKISQNENRTPLEGKHLSPLHKNHQG
jgi:hypothetical protein